MEVTAILLVYNPLGVSATPKPKCASLQTLRDWETGVPAQE